MDSTIIKEIISKHNFAELLLSIFFVLIDVILYLVFLFIFQNVSNSKFPHKKYLSYGIFYDIMIRIAQLFILFDYYFL